MGSNRMRNANDSRKRHGDRRFCRIVAAAALTLLVYNCAWAGAGGDTLHMGRVLRVVDGDTFIMFFEGRRESVRLIGIDAPESEDNAKVRRQARKESSSVRDIVELGRESKRFLQKVLRRASRVHLEFDLNPRDQYGRLLCYVYLKDGRMVNEVLVRSGYAWASSYPPNVKHQRRLQRAQREAEATGAGHWRSK